MWLLGAHMSVAGGHALAIERATAFNMTACQIFTKNANQWNAKPIAPRGGGELPRPGRRQRDWLRRRP